MKAATFAHPASTLPGMNSQRDPRELQIIRSWYFNAQAWSDAIRSASIAA